MFLLTSFSKKNYNYMIFIKSLFTNARKFLKIVCDCQYMHNKHFSFFSFCKVDLLYNNK